MGRHQVLVIGIFTFFDTQHIWHFMLESPTGCQYHDGHDDNVNWQCFGWACIKKCDFSRSFNVCVIDWVNTSILLLDSFVLLLRPLGFFRALLNQLMKIYEKSSQFRAKQKKNCVFYDTQDNPSLLKMSQKGASKYWQSISKGLKSHKRNSIWIQSSKNCYFVVMTSVLNYDNKLIAWKTETCKAQMTTEYDRIIPFPVCVISLILVIKFNLFNHYDIWRTHKWHKNVLEGVEKLFSCIW